MTVLGNGITQTFIINNNFSGGADLSGVTATAGTVLDGDIFVDAEGAEVEGTMPNNADNNVEITTLAGTTIPAGYYNGSGSAVLSAAEAAKVIPGNLKKDLVFLGETGSLEVAPIHEEKLWQSTMTDTKVVSTGLTLKLGSDV